MRKCEKLLVRSTAPPHLVSYTIHLGISNVHNILHGCYKTIVCTNCLFGTCFALTWRAQYSCTLATPEPNAFSNNKAPWRLSSFLIDLLLGFGDGTTNTPSATTHYPSFVDLNHWQLFPNPISLPEYCWQLTRHNGKTEPDARSALVQSERMVARGSRIIQGRTYTRIAGLGLFWF